MLSPAVLHLDRDIHTDSSHNLTDETVCLINGNTGSFQVKFISNSVPNLSHNYYAEISRNKLRNQLGHIRKDRLMSV